MHKNTPKIGEVLNVFTAEKETNYVDAAEAKFILKVCDSTL